jgi:hypothetical protein
MNGLSLHRKFGKKKNIFKENFFKFGEKHPHHKMSFFSAVRKNENKKNFSWKMSKLKQAQFPPYYKAHA